MNKKILEVCLSPGLGGLELFTLQCYQNFSQKGVCHIVAAPHKKLDMYINDSKVLHIKRAKFFPFIPAFRLAKYIDRMDIDILHFHWNKDIITVVLAKLLSNKKPSIILTRHMGMTRFKNDFYHKWLYRHISKIHAVTQKVKEQLIHFIPADIRPEIELIYLGVEPKKEIDTTFLKERHHLKDEFIVGIIGRIQEGKDQHIVIEAIAALKMLNLKLFIIGDTMDEGYLQQLHKLCKSLDIEERVIFTGFTKETDAYMQLCDITVLATKNETFGLVIIESMANGTPVIATDRGGPLEIIDDRKDGLLYDGTKEDLANKIAQLYDHREQQQLLKNSSLKKITTKFNKTNQLKKLYDFLI